MGVGFGYGLAHALSGIPAAQLRGNQYNDAQSLKDRQMQVNEDAEARAEAMSKEMITNSSDLRKQRQGAVKGLVMGYEAKDPIRVADSANAAQAPTPPPIPDGAQPPTQTPVESIGPNDVPPGYTQQLDGSWTDENGLPATPPGLGIGKGGPIQPGGQKGGMPVKGVSLSAKESKSFGYGAATAQSKTAPATQGKSEDLLRQGKSQMAPEEVVGLNRQSVQFQDEAAGVERRLSEAVKTVERQYAGDPTMLAYTKASLYASVRPHIDSLKQNAARAQQQAQFAAFAHKGGQFAESLLAHVEGGKTVDDAWIASVKPVTDDLGLDVGMLKGLHKNSAGSIVNGQGYVWPRQAIAEIANAALPWETRMKALEKVDGMFKIQGDMRAEMIRATNSDPTLVERWTLQQIAANDQLYQRSAIAYDNLENATRGTGKAEVVINDQNGRPVKKATIDRLPMGHSYEEWANSKDPNQQAFYQNNVKKIIDAKYQRGFIGEVLSNGFRAKTRAEAYKPSPEKEADRTGKKVFASTSAKNYATALSGWQSDKANWDKGHPGKPYPVTKPTDMGAYDGE